MSGILSTLTGATFAAAGPTLPVGSAVTASTISYGYQDYSRNTIAYVGPDSSNRPVFLFAYKNASNYLRVVLYRINDDGTITQGSEQGTSTTAIYRTIKATSEYEGANSFGNGSPTSFVYLCYHTTTPATFVQALDCNPSNLTCTFGTAVNISLTPDAEQPLLAYVGNNRVAVGARTGGGSFIKRYSRSSTTLTSEGTQSGDMASRIDNDLLGFVNNGTTQYRAGYFVTQNGASGTAYGAVALGSTNYVNYNLAITGTVFNMGCNLNNSNKMLGLSNNSNVIYLRVVDITWNASSNPGLAVGSASTFSDMTGSGGAAIVVSGHTANEAYVIYNGSTSTVDCRQVTVSGSTITLGSKVTMVSGLSNFYYSLSGSSATIGTKKYLTAIQVTNTLTPYIVGYRIA